MLSKVVEDLSLMTKLYHTNDLMEIPLAHFMYLTNFYVSCFTLRFWTFLFIPTFVCFQSFDHSWCGGLGLNDMALLLLA